MKKHTSFTKIGQFRDVISNINKTVTFKGLDSFGKPIYDNLAEKPILKFVGTVKLHGSFSAYVQNEDIYYQSRTQIITVNHDNMGFAFFAEGRKNVFDMIANKIRTELNLDKKLTVALFGEWAGQGIQKNVAISQLEKAFYLFAVKIVDLEDESKNHYLDFEECPFLKELSSPNDRIYNIYQFPTFEIEIDFNNPQYSQNKLAELTKQVADECPVAKNFGISGIGEGIVWKSFWKDQMWAFKVKDERHSASKVKTLASVDTEKLQNIQEFVDYAVTENRFEQGLQTIFAGEPLSMNKFGDLLRWMMNDIVSEEMETMTANGFEPKVINKYIVEKTKKMFMTELNNNFAR